LWHNITETSGTITPKYQLEHHPGYCIRQFADLIPYIAFDDVMRSKYIIRGRPTGVTNSTDYESGEIIARYANLD